MQPGCKTAQRSCNDCSCATPLASLTLPPAQRVTADFQSLRSPRTGGPDWPSRSTGRHRRRGGADAARRALFLSLLQAAADVRPRVGRRRHDDLAVVDAVVLLVDERRAALGQRLRELV